jgi:hypothetical protein
VIEKYCELGKIAFLKIILGFTMKKTFQALFVLFLLSLTIPGAAMAGQYPDKIVEKLGNGLANAVTGVGELPKRL